MTERRPSALQKVVGRSMKVTAAEADAFPWDHTDLLLAEALLSPGVITWQDVAAHAEVPVSTVKERLQDPVRAAWMSREISKGIESRLGLALAAVWGRVLRTGDVNGAKLLLAQYGQLVQPVAQTEHRHLHLDLSALSSDELKAFIAERQKTLGTDALPGTSVVGGVQEGRREADPLPTTFEVAEVRPSAPETPA